MSGSRWLVFSSVILGSGLFPSTARAADTDKAAAIAFFETKIRPLLVNNCYTCHSANTNSRGELRVDDINGLLNGGASGPAVVPGDPGKSLLITAVSHAEKSLKMPPKKKLTDEQIADLTRWVQEGAAWPAVEAVKTVGKSNEKYDKLRKEHWAWQPVKSPSVPQPKDASWPRDDIDRFILAKLEEQGLKPVRDADKATLIRRVSFDLTGLPPTVEEIDAFQNDESPDAYARLVDRLLASPAYGERWARHWLDVARFGESTGSSRNLPFPHAWRYRDYVIDAFTNDKPFDRFIQEQVAGDLLPAKSEAEADTNKIATGFLAVGVKDVNQRFKVRYIMENVDEQIDTVSRAVLGLTVSCARCHDHKFDPIPTSDYYALAGIFRSSDLCAGLKNKMGGSGLDYYDTDMLIVLGDSKKGNPEHEKKVAAATEALKVAKAEFRRLLDDPEGDVKTESGRPKRFVAYFAMMKCQNDLIELKDPAAQGAKIAQGVRDAKTIADTEIRVRGEAEKLGPVVPRGFLSVLDIPEIAKPGPSQSGRLELAQWLTSPKNPLTPRVLANRVWRHLFEQGLVKSVDNFGFKGDTASHPELLDHLAGRFVQNGWSVKSLVRAIVLSRAYQLDSESSEKNSAVDPSNRFVWRHAPRRLDAEEIHDAALVVAGKLDATRPEASPAKDFKVIELPNNGVQARDLREKARDSRHRGIYFPLLRGIIPTSLEVFDFAEQGMVTGSRDTTTVATQALYLLNDPFVRLRAHDLADRLLAQTDLDDLARVNRAYRLALGRWATSDEADRARNFLADYENTVSGTWKDDIAEKPEKPQQPEKAEPAAVAVVANAGGNAGGAAPAVPKKPAAPVNPDEIIMMDHPERDVRIRASNPKAEAWASFCQALLGSAEFRYVK